MANIDVQARRDRLSKPELLARWIACERTRHYIVTDYLRTGGPFSYCIRCLVTFQDGKPINPPAPR